MSYFWIFLETLTGRENCPRDRVFQILCLCGFEHDRGMLPNIWWQTTGLLQQHLRYASDRWVWWQQPISIHPICVVMWYAPSGAVQSTRYKDISEEYCNCLEAAVFWMIMQCMSARMREALRQHKCCWRQTCWVIRLDHFNFRLCSRLWRCVISGYKAWGETLLARNTYIYICMTTLFDFQWTLPYCGLLLFFCFADFRKSLSGCSCGLQHGARRQWLSFRLDDKVGGPAALTNGREPVGIA